MVVAAVVVMLFLIHPDWFLFASWCQQNYLMVFIAWEWEVMTIILHVLIMYMVLLFC